MATYKLLDSYTVGSGGASSVTFNNINQLYTDLEIRMSVRTTTSAASEALLVSFNGSTSNFSGIYLTGSGSATYSGTFPRFAGWADASTATSSVFGSTSLYIPNYTSSNNKPYTFDSVDENNATAADQGLHAGLWSDTSAITSITLTGNSGGNFAQYSTFELYGVSNQPATAAPAGTTTIGTAYSSGNTSANVPFTYSGTDASYYVATSSPGGFTATATTSPLTVTGLTTGTAYTFTVKPYNFAYGPGAASSASNSVTPYGDYVALSTVTVDSGGASSITFSNIPQGFKHLQIRGLYRYTTALDVIAIRLNSDTSAAYSTHSLFGSGTSAASDHDYNSTYTYLGYIMNSSTGYGASITDVLDYASTSKNKTLRSLSGTDLNGSGYVNLNSGAWYNTSAINSITIYPGAGTLSQYSQFELYGVN